MTTTSTTSFNASLESTPSSNYVTTVEDSIYQTAETGENQYFNYNRRLRHRNLVMPSGWCTEHGEMLVAYDYSANRKVSHLLFHNRISRNSVLRWKSRYNEIKSLAYKVMNPRLCGFALAEFLSRNDKAHSSYKKGRIRSRDLRLYGTRIHGIRRGTTMTDVYSFGMVVLEMVMGHPLVDYMRKNEDALLVLTVENPRSSW
ncbi:hypothetical protein ARALYDRAFT_893591 [Arabidopsis lyrata subsp. lyrata]|uniref:Protein kinase domain-containing protein n=1 Tax=Arabidopsis lyrata subsp. lyrata TaxID=81972 RepID=D7KXS4_ARALL|nr:hypothetical protein ARALYDRAFT_893591 [Arabidopsis lyrata subsp. lyrata]